MKITILAVGRLPRSPEVELVKLYVDRATAAGRSLGLGPVEVIEVESRKPGKGPEAEVLRPHLEGAHVIACDEHGTARASRAFAGEIARLRDDGARRLVFVIGGAAGVVTMLGLKAFEARFKGPMALLAAIGIDMISPPSDDHDGA